MGYFSELDFVQHEDTGWSGTAKLQELADQMELLNERLLVVQEDCPHDMCDPNFDRMFYSECLSEVDNDLTTVQGVLQAIRNTEDQLRIAEEEERRESEEQQRWMEWRNTVLETGATPDYQIVLVSVFFPAAGHSVAA